MQPPQGYRASWNATEANQKSEAHKREFLTFRLGSESYGIDSMKVMLSGVQDSIFVWKNLASPDSVRRDTSFVVGPNPGILAISARAWSRAGHEGSTAAPVEIEVVNTQVADTEAPRVGLTVTTPERVELDDSIQVRLVAEDQGTAGLRRVGVLMIALPDTTALAPDTLVIDEVFASPRTGQVDRTFHVRLADFPFSDTGTVRMPRRRANARCAMPAWAISWNWRTTRFAPPACASSKRPPT